MNSLYRFQTCIEYTFTEQFNFTHNNTFNFAALQTHCYKLSKAK